MNNSSTSPESSKGVTGSTTALCAPARTTICGTRRSTDAELGRHYPAFHLPPISRLLPTRWRVPGRRSAASSRMYTQRSRTARRSGPGARGRMGRDGERRMGSTDRGVVEAGRLVLTAGAWSQESRGSRGSRPRRATGPRLAAADQARAVHPRPPAGLQPRLEASTSTASRRSESGFQTRSLRALRRGGDPDTISREPTRRRAPLRAFAERYFPDGAGPTIALKTCLFEPSPDEHFLIDRHPETENGRSRRRLLRRTEFKLLLGGRRSSPISVLDGTTRHDIDFRALGSFLVPRLILSSRGRGGTGRRGGFRSRWASALGGSSPPARTALVRAKVHKGARVAAPALPESSEPGSPCSGRVAACE